MKFVLDTNVISELMRPAPSQRVVAWVGSHATEQMYLTSVVEAELRYGIAILPADDRRTRLARALEAMLADDFPNDALPFDSAAARVYADFAAHRRAVGRPISHEDCQIAAVTSTASATLVTRDVGDFAGLGLDVVDPFAA